MISIEVKIFNKFLARLIPRSTAERLRSICMGGRQMFKKSTYTFFIDL